MSAKKAVCIAMHGEYGMAEDFHPRPNAANDAQLMSDTLAQQGFETHTLINPCGLPEIAASALLGPSPHCRHSHS